MAKTLMVSNDVYNELKVLKESKNVSFSELISGLIESKSYKGENLKKFLGLLKGDKEYDKLIVKLNEEWPAWQK